jgi:hypothetical protein
MQLIPHEIDVAGVFLSPMLFAGAFGVIAAWLTVAMLNRYRLSRLFFYPPLVFVAMVVIYGTVFATFVIPG